MQLKANIPPYWAFKVPGLGVDLDFVNNRGWQLGFNAASAASFLTCSRASTGYASDTFGNYYAFSSNVPRITNQGLLVEEPRTNSVRNNTGTGAANPSTLPTIWSAIVQGGLTQTIVGDGTENGIAYTDLNYAGTANAGGVIQIQFEQFGGVAATYGQTWAGSVFIRISGGSLANITGQNIFINGGASGSFLNQPAIAAYTPGANTANTLGSNRNVISGTTLGATLSSVILATNLTFLNGAVINVTLRIGWPQLELNSLINSTVASAVVAAGGTVTGASRTMGVYGGTGTPATVAATIAATAVTAISSIPAAGSYTTLAPSPAPIGDWIGNASISGTTLTINSTAFGAVAVGQTVGGGTVSAATTIVSGSGSSWIVSNTQTVASTNLYSFGGTTVPTVTLTPTNNATQGFATSPIPTTNAAATRSADSIQLKSALTFGAAYTLYASGAPQAPSGYAGNQFIIGVADTTSGANRTFLFRANSTGNTAGSISASGVGQTAGVNSVAWSQNAIGKIALSYSPVAQASNFNGTNASTFGSTTGPTSLTQVDFGSRWDQGSNFYDGYIKGVALWPSTALSASQLTAITAGAYSHP